MLPVRDNKPYFIAYSCAVTKLEIKCIGYPCGGGVCYAGALLFLVRIIEC